MFRYRLPLSTNVGTQKHHFARLQLPHSYTVPDLDHVVTPMRPVLSVM